MFMREFIYTVILFVLFSSLNYSQTIWKCDTDNNVSSLNKSMSQIFSQPDYVSLLSSADVQVFLHIIRSSSGNGGFTTSEVNNALNIAKNDYSSLGITLTSLGVGYIDNDNFANFDGTLSEFNSLVATNNHEFAIDIYFVKNTDYGRANGIPSSELVIGNSYVGTSVLSHEIGHCLGLFHTHSGRGCNDFANCEEAIDGSNCISCGDLVCDTPADPCLSGNVDVNCTYTGPSNFNPDIDNIMSYSPPNCLSDLTQGQNDRIFSMIESNAVLLKVLKPTLSGTIQVDEYWYNTVSLNGNISVPSGKTLTIKTGATINLNG